MFSDLQNTMKINHYAYISRQINEIAWNNIQRHLMRLQPFDIEDEYLLDLGKAQRLLAGEVFPFSDSEQAASVPEVYFQIFEGYTRALEGVNERLKAVVLSDVARAELGQLKEEFERCIARYETKINDIKQVKDRQNIANTHFMHVDEKITRSLMTEDISGDIWNIIMFYIGENESNYAKIHALLFWVIFQDFAHPVNGKNFSVTTFNNDPRGKHHIKLYNFSWLKEFGAVISSKDYVVYWKGVRQPFHEIAKAANKHERDEQFQTYKDIQKNIRSIVIRLWKVAIRKYKNSIQRSIVKYNIRDPRVAIQRVMRSMVIHMGNKVYDNIIKPMENMFDDIFDQVNDLINEKAHADFLIQGPRPILTLPERQDAYTGNYMARFFLRIRATAKISGTKRGLFFGSHNFTRWVQRRTIYGNLSHEIRTDSELFQIFSSATNVVVNSSALSAGAVRLAADGLALATLNMDVDEAMSDPIMGLRDEVHLNIPVYKYALLESYDTFAQLASARFPVLQIERLQTGLIIVNLNMEAKRLGFEPNMFIREVVEPSMDGASASAQETTFRLVRFLPTLGSITEEEALTADLSGEFGMNDITPESPDEVGVSEGLDVIMSL